MIVMLGHYQSGIRLDVSLDRVEAETLILPIFISILPVTVCWNEERRVSRSNPSQADSGGNANGRDSRD